MTAAPPWYRIATDRPVLRRAAITSVGVGTILTVANHFDDLAAGSMADYQAIPIAITFLVPLLVSLASSVIAVRVERHRHAADSELLERQIAAINKFPDQNPNPVLRMTEEGHLTYANPAARPILDELGLAVGRDFPRETFDALVAAAAETAPGRVEIETGRQTFSILAVHVPELGVYNLYCTDVTGAKVVERFPDRNPSPVLRLTPTGELRYANKASDPITAALDTRVGHLIPGELLAQLEATLANAATPPPEVSGAGRTYRLQPVRIPEFDFINVYGTDVTAIRAIDKFPRENPNPVLRLTHEGRLTYGNPASALIQQALGAAVGEQLQPAVFQKILDALGDAAIGSVELEAGDRIFSVRVVRVFEFDWINLYGTDVTAARQVERLNADNERLLLNILPASIAARLRGGEVVIADRFEDMTVLFADVVGFTEMSARMPPHEVVDLLNRVFTMCDQLADKYGLEKIKTVGDAYMVVGGMNLNDGTGEHNRSSTHAADVVDMALEMLDELGRLRDASGVAISMRVGMHVGPVVAGVIGLKKFIYDVWGDTVNMASRMESTGVPDRVQVSRETRERLSAQFELERRGFVEVKGKGQIETWFVTRRRGPGHVG